MSSRGKKAPSFSSEVHATSDLAPYKVHGVVEREKGLKNQTPASITPLFRHPLPCSRIIYFSLVQMAWSLPNGRIPHRNAPTPCPWEEGKGRFLASAERSGQGDQTKVMVAGRGYIRSPVELVSGMCPIPCSPACGKIQIQI